MNHFLLLNRTMRLVVQGSLIDQMILCHLDVHLLCRIERNLIS